MSTEWKIYIEIVRREIEGKICNTNKIFHSCEKLLYTCYRCCARKWMCVMETLYFFFFRRYDLTCVWSIIRLGLKISYMTCYIVDYWGLSCKRSEWFWLLITVKNDYNVILSLKLDGISLKIFKIKSYELAYSC